MREIGAKHPAVTGGDPRTRAVTHVAIGTERIRRRGLRRRRAVAGVETDADRRAFDERAIAVVGIAHGDLVPAARGPVAVRRYVREPSTTASRCEGTLATRTPAAASGGMASSFSRAA